MQDSSLKEPGSSIPDIQDFPYRPLEHGEIRLLTIDAAQTTDQNEAIRCSLNHYLITSPLPSSTLPRYEWGDYVALSYSWGWDSQNPSRQICIDGHPYNVTESLEAALQTFRISQTATTSSDRFWVDALCINQSDPKEVKGEILRMREIYSQAARVYAHLGPETEDSNLGFQLIHTMSEALSKSVENVYRELANKRFSPTNSERRAYKAMLKILNRPYWHRVWVLQELAMSHSSIIVACGAMELLLEDILPVSRFICLNTENILFLLGEDPATSQLIGLHTMLQMYTLKWATREQKYRNLQRTTLGSKLKYLDIRHPLLILAQSAEATRSHDNVYGLLGIMPEPIRQSMSPYIDYDLPITTVFTAFSRTIIECTEDLDAIFAKRFGQTMTPSWATDWTMSIDRATLPHDWDLCCYDQFDGAYDDFHEVVASSARYRADGGRKPQISFITDGCTNTLLLKCPAVCIGAIDGIGVSFPSGEQTTRLELVQPRSTRNPYGDEEEAITRALIHTLFANPNWGDTVGASLFHIPWIAHHESPSTYLSLDGTLNLTNADAGRVAEMQRRGWTDAISNNFLTFDWWRRCLSQFRIRGKTFQDYFVSDIVDCAFPPERVKLDIATAVGVHVSRCLITLDSGHFGLAPYTVEGGDKVFVLLGCSMPVVLRPVSGSEQFQVVGECFVDGYWNGEAWDGVERGDFEVRDVVLC